MTTIEKELADRGNEAEIEVADFFSGTVTKAVEFAGLLDQRIKHLLVRAEQQFPTPNILEFPWSIRGVIAPPRSEPIVDPDDLYNTYTFSTFGINLKTGLRAVEGFAHKVYGDSVLSWSLHSVAESYADLTERERKHVSTIANLGGVSLRYQPLQLATPNGLVIPFEPIAGMRSELV